MVDETHYFKVAFEMGKEFKLLSHPFLKHEQKRVTSTVRSEVVVKKAEIFRRGKVDHENAGLLGCPELSPLS